MSWTGKLESSASTYFLLISILRKSAALCMAAGGEIRKSGSVSFVGAADGVPQAGHPAPPNAQMRALNSYFYFYSTFLSFRVSKLEGTSKHK